MKSIARIIREMRDQILERKDLSFDTECELKDLFSGVLRRLAKIKLIANENNHDFFIDIDSDNNRTTTHRILRKIGKCLNEKVETGLSDEMIGAISNNPGTVLPIVKELYTATLEFYAYNEIKELMDGDQNSIYLDEHIFDLVALLIGHRDAYKLSDKYLDELAQKAKERIQIQE